MTTDQIKNVRRFAHRTNIGLSFINSDRVWVRCFQLLNEDGFAVAVADFEGAKLTRFQSAWGTEDAADWLEYVKARL